MTDKANQYIWRPAGNWGNGLRPASVYHNVGPDGTRSACGAATVGEAGFRIVEKTRVLRSLRCSNCLTGIVVRA